MIKIALDAMGGDHAPQSVVEGAIQAQKDGGDDYQIVLVGEDKRIRQELSRLKATDSPFEIEHASDSISMEDQALESLRRKKNSSIAVGMRLQKERKVDAFVSGGNTGAVMATALLTLGRLEGVSRPAIASFIPAEKDIVVVLDVGANVECKAQNLYEFGVMGSIYTDCVLKKQNPRVGLLSIGEEDSKGNELTFLSNKLLRESCLNFVGNVEGQEILKGTCDVVVCDGFVGNIVLKFAESIDGFLTYLVRKRSKTSLLFKLGAFLLKFTLRDIRKLLDYAEYGGAPLLGVDGTCIICHGKSSPKAIKNAIKMAARMVKENINFKIKQKLVENHRKVN